MAVADPRRARAKIGLLALALLLVSLVLGRRPVLAGDPVPRPLADPSAQTERMRLIWAPASVVWPLDPVTGASPRAALDQREAMLAGRAPASSTRGVVEIDRRRAAGVWVAALETVRVRQLDGPEPIRLVRFVDGDTVVIEPGRALASCPDRAHDPRCWELSQPPSDGGLWSIEADQPARVLIERAVARSPRYVAVELEHDLLEWIDRDPLDAAMPAVFEPDDEDGVADQLALDAALAEALIQIGGGERAIERAIKAWRMLSAIAAVDRSRPAVRPYFAPSVAKPKLAGTRPVQLAVADSRRYRLAAPDQRWTIRCEGPGQLRIAARAWAPIGQALADAELRVRVEGRVIERIPLLARQARRARDPDTALPLFVPMTTESGEPVGELARETVVLAPRDGTRIGVDANTYELELVGGPALIDLEAIHRIEATAAAARGWTPNRRARALTRALARSQSAARPWLELLATDPTHAPLPIGSADPRFDELARTSPLLASAGLVIAARAEPLDADAIARLVTRVRPWLVALDRDPTLAPGIRGQLRARWLELAALHRRPDLAARIVAADPRAGNDPITELPVAALRTLAEQVPPTPNRQRSGALALLELARRRGPADDQLRGQFLDAWTDGSRWSEIDPDPDPDTDTWPAPIGEWLIPRPDQGDAPARPRGSELGDRYVALELDEPVRIQVSLEPGKMRLLDVHVSTPPGTQEPVAIRVDANQWWSPPLATNQRHRVALGPGDHEIEITGPPGTVAWAGPLAPDELDPTGPEAHVARRKRMWSLARSVWTLPGPAAPGFVRVELRWPEQLARRPVRIRVIESGGRPHPAQVVVFDPRGPGKDSPVALPIAGSSQVGERHDIVLAVAADTTQLRFEVDGELELPASLAIRRGIQDRDLPRAGHDDRRSALDSDPGSDPDSDPIRAALRRITSLDHDALVAEVAANSRTLLHQPSQIDARAERAALLLLLGDSGHARADLQWLTGATTNTRMSAARRAHAQRWLAELEQRLEAFTDPREITVADPNRVATPILIEPAIAAVVGADRPALDPWLSSDATTEAALARIESQLAQLSERAERAGSHTGNTGPASADLDRQQLIGSLARAQLLARDPGHARAAARAWLSAYGRLPGAPGSAREPIAVGLAAAAALLAHLDDPRSDARDAGVAYGLARALEPVYGHTSIRRLMFVAALRSDWSRLSHSQDNVGFERLELPLRDRVPTPGAEVRAALLVAPWPAGEAELLRPARKGVLSWDADAGSVTVQLWCRVTRPDLASPARPGRARAQLRVRLRGGRADAAVIERELELADAVLGTVELQIPRGSQQLEVELGDDPTWSCSWRTVADASGASEPIAARRRGQWWTAESDHGVELIVLGPTTVELELRAVVPARGGPRPTVARVRVESVDRPGGRGGPGQAETAPLGLAPTLEPAVVRERQRRFEVSHATSHRIVLTERGPQRITVTSDVGRVLVRAQRRRDRGDLPPPSPLAPGPRAPATSPTEPPPWLPTSFASVGTPLGLIAHEPVPPIRNRVGTLDVRVRAGLDQIADVDDLDPRMGLITSLGWRRALLDHTLWIALSGEARLRERSAPAAGGSLRFAARLPPLGVRLGAELELLAEPFAGRTETSVRLYGFVDRPIWLGPYVQLRPALITGLRWQSLDPGRVAAATGPLEPNPRVYLRYIHDHPVVLQPELALRVYPLQDLAVFTDSQVILNSDLHSVDHVNVEWGVVGIARRPLPWVPTWGLGYQLSPRFADGDRPAPFIRHRIETQLGLAVWARDRARVAMGVTNQLFVSSVAPVRDVIELWLRVDASLGRRMRDYGPRELWFREPWAPRAWGDDEHQARSTYTPSER